jgi:CDP-glucose 4,6-dehydratase
MQVAERLFQDGPSFGESWNFGPELSDAITVESIVQFMAEAWEQGAQWHVDSSEQAHEAQYLKLDWSKAADRLHWRPALRLVDALRITMDWYKAYSQGTEVRDMTVRQIASYADLTGSRAKAKGVGIQQ